MTLPPFGVLKEQYRNFLTGVDTPMIKWPETEGQQKYTKLVRRWMSDVEEAIWPRWENGGWVGKAAGDMEGATRRELELAVQLYHGGGGSGDVLDEVPDVPPAPDGRERNQAWHYRVEDGQVDDPGFTYIGLPPTFAFRSSSGLGANYLLYEPEVDIDRFRPLWQRLFSRQPGIFDIKVHFQRSRPWALATLLKVGGFRWITADGAAHTGIHPSILSGHCIQGILGGCVVYEALLDGADIGGSATSDKRDRALQKYMVDWGDRRVFAGVHYMTDNIASWTLARRLIPHLFRNAKQVETFAVGAIVRHSRVFRDILRHFPKDDRAVRMLKGDFPEWVDAPADGTA